MKPQVLFSLALAALACLSGPTRAQDSRPDSPQDSRPDPGQDPGPGSGAGQDQPPELDTEAGEVVTEGAAAGEAAEQQTPYEVELTGADGELADLLKGTATLFQLKDQPPPSIIGLRRRADTDRERLRTALRSAGYYDSSLGIRINARRSPAKVTIKVEPGERYRFGTVRLIDGKGNSLAEPAIDPAGLGVVTGQPARAAAVLDGEDRITGAFARAGYAYGRVTDRRLVVDHATRQMAVDYVVDPGPLVRLGTVSVNGLDRVREKTAQRRIAWKPGQTRYNPDRLEDFRTALSELGVFSSMRVRLADQPPADGAAPAGPITVPVTVDVRERERRYIALGAKYATTDGFGANATWGHRNLLGGAERLEVITQISGIGRSGGGGSGFGTFDYRLGTSFKKPDFLSRNQHLLLAADLLAEHPDAYDRKAAILSAALERHFNRRLVGTAGLSFEQSRVTDSTGRRTDNTLFGLPVSLAWDKSNDLLNPNRGFRLNASVTPYLAAFGSATHFTIGRVGGSVYVPLSSNGHTVWASRALAGAIIGDVTLEIPADKRFFSGGGGSVRGYAYQKIGPRDADGDPLGGRSLFEVGTELRFRVTESIGLVPFIDGGNVFQTAYPRLNEGLRWGTGLGVRYLTGFGPLRLDVGFPLNRRRGESRWQLYISLGQAF